MLDTCLFAYDVRAAVKCCAWRWVSHKPAKQVCGVPDRHIHTRLPPRSIHCPVVNRCSLPFRQTRPSHELTNGIPIRRICTSVYAVLSRTDTELVCAAGLLEVVALTQRACSLVTICTTQKRNLQQHMQPPLLFLPLLFVHDGDHCDGKISYLALYVSTTLVYVQHFAA